MDIMIIVSIMLIGNLIMWGIMRKHSEPSERIMWLFIGWIGGLSAVIAISVEFLIEGIGGLFDRLDRI